jgi:hypothetical protein
MKGEKCQHERKTTMEVDADAAAVCGEDQCGEVGNGEGSGAATGRDESVAEEG